MRIDYRMAIVSLAVITSAALFTGCSSTTGPAQSGPSRVRFYSSVSELAGDSAVVIAGVVTAQRTATDINPETELTISTVTVSAVPKGQSLVAGSTVEVRQFGSAKQEGPAPLLVVRSGYLLYLTGSGLKGELANQYYVTGSDAGLYAATSPDSLTRSSGSFRQMQANQGDHLPATITLGGASG